MLSVFSFSEMVCWGTLSAMLILDAEFYRSHAKATWCEDKGHCGNDARRKGEERKGEPYPRALLARLCLLPHPHLRRTVSTLGRAFEVKIPIQAVEQS